jgi:maltoporin
VDQTGKGQQPFQAPLAGAKYRLGNEAETYLETMFAYGAAMGADDPGRAPAYFDTQVRIAHVTPTSQTSTTCGSSA